VDVARDASNRLGRDVAAAACGGWVRSARSRVSSSLRRSSTYEAYRISAALPSGSVAANSTDVWPPPSHVHQLPAPSRSGTLRLAWSSSPRSLPSCGWPWSTCSQVACPSRLRAAQRLAVAHHKVEKKTSTHPQTSLGSLPTFGVCWVSFFCERGRAFLWIGSGLSSRSPPSPPSPKIDTYRVSSLRSFW
jgi:hypothetical protein